MSFRTTAPHQPSPYDCDFEIDACAPSWNITFRPEISWTRVQGSIVSQQDEHVPLYDHSANNPNGYYLLLKPNIPPNFPSGVNTESKSFVCFELTFLCLFLVEYCFESISKFNYQK